MRRDWMRTAFEETGLDEIGPPPLEAGADELSGPTNGLDWIDGQARAFGGGIAIGGDAAVVEVIDRAIFAARPDAAVGILVECVDGIGREAVVDGIYLNGSVLGDVIEALAVGADPHGLVAGLEDRSDHILGKALACAEGGEGSVAQLDDAGFGETYPRDGLRCLRKRRLHRRRAGPDWWYSG